MIKVLIVDDEKLICEWMEFCVSQNPACQLVGIGHNGREGLELFQKYEPDLILTDIKMPVMDGMELLHAVRAQSSTVKVVLLTAFAEFEMARQALRDGAYDYLLKTEMNKDMLQELLNRVCKTVSMSDANNDNTIATAQAHAIIRKIMRQKAPLGENDLTALRQCGVRWKNNGLFALAVWKQNLMGGGLQFPENGPARHIAGFDYNDRIYMVVGNLPNTLSNTEKSRNLRNYAWKLKELNQCMVGISTTTDDMRMIPALVRHAALSLSRGFYEGVIRLYEPVQTLEQLEERDRAWHSGLPALRARLYQQHNEERYRLIEDFLNETAKKQVGEVDLLTKFCTDIYDLLYAEAVSAGLNPEDSEKVHQLLATSISMAEVSKPVLELAALCRNQNQNRQPHSKAVQLALKFIRSHYAQPISQEQVAAEVYLTPEYFSRIFKEETGVTFVNYLADIRLHHSLQLLDSTALRVQDVAQQVGYPNVSYFSTVFKKKYGMSPYEYRHHSE